MTIRLRAVGPEVPEPKFWVPYLEETKHLNWHSNFGPLCLKFEGILGEKYAFEGESVVSASSATAGLTACLIAERIKGPVLCAAFTFQATPAAILAASCQPIIVDVEEGSGIVTPEILARALDDTGAKAAILVAPYGIAADFRKHAAVCEARGALLILDCAAGLGIDRRADLGHAPSSCVREVYSLHATKPFGIGEGGAIIAPSRCDAALRSALNFGLKSHTKTGDDQGPYWGINGKLSEVAAAVGLSVCDDMDARVVARQSMVERWIAALSPLPVTLFSRAVERSPWQVFPVLMPDENRVETFIAAMSEVGVEILRYYQPSLGDCRGMAHYAPCLNAAALSRRAVVLPVRSFMSEGEQKALMEETCTTLKKCL